MTGLDHKDDNGTRTPPRVWDLSAWELIKDEDDGDYRLMSCRNSETLNYVECHPVESQIWIKFKRLSARKFLRARILGLLPSPPPGLRGGGPNLP